MKEKTKKQYLIYLDNETRKKLEILKKKNNFSYSDIVTILIKKQKKVNLI